MTDPSFARQLITFTTAHVGNYGDQREAWESDRIHAAGAIMREAINTDRRARRRAGLARLAGRRTASRASQASTRARWCGTSAPRGRCAAGSSRPRCPRPTRWTSCCAEPSMVGRDLAREVTVAEPRVEGEGGEPADRRARHRHQALDRAQLRRSAGFSSSCTRARRRPTSCWRATPTGSSSCPGPATRRRSTTSSTRSASLLVRKPVFGICLGHQLLSRAAGPGDVQAAVRPPRRQPPGQGPRDRPDRDHLAEPRVRGGRRARPRGSSPSSAPPS